jgi:flagellar motor switch protein FliN
MPENTEQNNTQKVVVGENIAGNNKIEYSHLGLPNLNVMKGGESFDSKIFDNIPVELSVELGRATLNLYEILNVAKGDIIELEKIIGDPLNLVINGQIIARGEVVVVDNKYGIKITKVEQIQDKK